MTLALAAASGAIAAQCTKPIPNHIPFDPTQLSEHVRILASDELAGREPGSDGEKRTVRYLSEKFAAAGLTAAGDRGTWTQAVELRRFTLSGPISVQLRQTAGAAQWQTGIDWTGVSLAGLSDVEIVSAPVVFVGYGVSAPERGWDDYKDVDLRGKVAVFLINDPDFDTPQSGRFGGKAMTYYGRWTYKFEEAAKRGAAAALIVHEEAPASYGWNTVRNSWAVPQFDIERPDPRAVHPLVEGWLTHQTATRMFERAGLAFKTMKQRAMNADFVPLVLKDTYLSVSAHVKIAHVVSHNVIGELSGRTRPEESVIFSAHWDHLGLGAPDPSGDRIYNGAADNAIGVAGLLELARVFAGESRTARSVLFVAFTGEEKNLLGSKYYVQHPIRPLERTAAVFNMDIFTAAGPACDVRPWGTRQNTLESEIAIRALSAGRTLMPDRNLAAGYYYRSDHLTFAQHGVPAITIGSGRALYHGGEERGEQLYDEYIRLRYHQPSDEWSADWDLRGPALDLRLLHETGRDIADSSHWPQWLPDSEFKALRDNSSSLRRPKH